jgi:hypothetical protein
MKSLFRSKFRNLLCFLFFLSSSFVSLSQCIVPNIPVIIGPISLCGSVEFPIDKPSDYYIWEPQTGVSYSWSVVGGTFASGNTGTNVSVQWGGGSGPFSLSALSSNGCMGIMYMNDCDCPRPDLVSSGNVVVDLNDQDHIHGGILDLNHIAAIIDPNGGHTVVYSNYIRVHDWRFQTN